MATATQKLITAEEFFRMPDPPDGSKQELVRREIVTMPPPGFRHGIRQVRAATLLDQFAHTSRSGRVTVESGVVTERDPDTVRGPHVSFWSFERLPADQEPEGYPNVAPDLCVEVISPGDRLQRMTEKLREYFAPGVQWSGSLTQRIGPSESTVRWKKAGFFTRRLRSVAKKCCLAFPAAWPTCLLNPEMRINLPWRRQR